MKVIVGFMILVFFFGGIGVIYLGVQMLAHRIRRKPFMRTAEGTILKFEQRVMRSSSGNRMHSTTVHFPVIQYSTDSGHLVTFRSESGRSANAAIYTTGQKVQVIYDPESPEDAHINTRSALYFTPVTMIIGGLIILGTSVLIAFLFGERILK